MAGIQIDGVNNKIDFDDDADTSISSATDDILMVMFLIMTILMVRISDERIKQDIRDSNSFSMGELHKSC
jgi:hypothetical protein